VRASVAQGVLAWDSPSLILGAALASGTSATEAMRRAVRKRDLATAIVTAVCVFLWLLWSLCKCVGSVGLRGVFEEGA